MDETYLFKVFGDFGTVKNVKLVRGDVNKPGGYCFVEFEAKHVALDLVERFKNKIFTTSDCRRTNDYNTTRQDNYI